MSKLQARGKKTKENILWTAFELFHSQGVNATSVDEILEKSGTGKSQFYHYFGSKDDLLQQVVQNFYDALRRRVMPIKYDIESWEDLEQWFSTFIKHQRDTNCERGCPMATIGYELTEEHEVIRERINLTFEFTLNSLSRFFHKLREQGKLKESADPDEMASFCLFILQGGMVISKLKKETSSFETSAKHAINYLKSLEK